MSAPYDRLPLNDPKLLPFLPMLYIAWADGELEAEEIEAICPELEGECRCLVEPWLDPEKPPSAAELGRMLGIIRRTAEKLDTRQKLDLAGLGLSLAQAHREDEWPVSDAERDALKKLQESLGIAGTEAARQLLTSRRTAKRQPEADAEFDVDALASRLAGPWASTRRRVFDLLAEPGFAALPDLGTTAYREHVLRACRRLAGAGLGRLSFPEEHGGQGDVGAFITAFATLAYGDLSLLVKFGVQFGLFGGSILNLGTAKHHDAYLPAVGRLELSGCFAMTETGHGSNVADLETRAAYDPGSDEFVVHTPSPGAIKDYIGNAAAHGRMATVFAQLQVGDEEHGVHAFLVPIRDEAGDLRPGVSISDDGMKMGLNGVDNGRLSFAKVRIPREALLDRFATVSEDGVYKSPIASPSKRFFTMLGTLVGGRVSVAMGGAAVAQKALAIAVRYAVRRRQFGPGGEAEMKLLDYPSHQRRLLPRLATSYALAFALDRLRDDYTAAQAEDPVEHDHRELESEAAGLKALATWHCTDTVQECREACGGQGYLWANEFADMKADTDVFTTFEGDNTVLLLLVAKNLLSGVRDRFHSMGLVGLVRYVGERARHELAHLDPVATRKKDREHLLDRTFHLDAFRWRRDQLLQSVAARLKARIEAGMDANDAMLETQNHLLATARAATELLVLERFADGIEATAGTAEKKILGRLSDLYALSRLEADRAHFLEEGYFEPAKARAIRDLVSELCGELRPQARHLVDAFAIPNHLIRAPIAR